METGSEEAAERAAGDSPPEEAAVEEVAEKQIYLRTVYTLNPGIPHFVDVPGGW